MSKKKYEVVTPVDFNNKRYEPGKVLALEDADAESLVNVGAVRESTESEKPEK